MKICHICENITKITHCVSCLTCKRSFCFPCISKFYPAHKDRYLPKSPADTFKQIRTKQCLYCLKICRCLKCSTDQAIVPTLGNIPQPEQLDGSFNVSMEEALQESALFAGKKVTELPGFLQRIFNKKKVIYSKHQISVPANEDPEEAQISHHEETSNKDHSRRVAEEGIAGESGDLGEPPAAQENNSELKMKAQNEADQADLQPGEEPSRSAYLSREVREGSKMEAEGEGEGEDEEEEEDYEEDAAEQNEPRQSQQLSENEEDFDSGQQEEPEEQDPAHSGEGPKGEDN